MGKYDRYPDEQKAHIIKQVDKLRYEDGYGVKNACKIVGVADQTYYTWKAKSHRFAHLLGATNTDDVTIQKIRADVLRILEMAKDQVNMGIAIIDGAKKILQECTEWEMFRARQVTKTDDLPEENPVENNPVKMHMGYPHEDES